MMLDLQFPYLGLYPTTPAENGVLCAMPSLAKTSTGVACVWWTRTETVLTHLLRHGCTLQFVSAEAEARFAEARVSAFLVDSKIKFGAIPGAPPFRLEDYSALILPPYRLREYQARAAHHLIHHPVGCLLGDAMGLGKTLTSLLAAHRLAYLQPSAARTVVVCPSGLRRQWKNEIVAALASPLGEAAYAPTDVVVYEGAPKVRAALLRLPCRFLIVPYELLMRDLTTLVGAVVDGKGTRAIILDEAGKLKNPASKTWQAVRDLVERAAPGRIFALNGTPVENALHDVWAQLAVCCPAAFPSFAEFEFDHVRKMRLKGPNGITVEKVIGHRALDVFNLHARGARVRRDYRDVDEELPAVVVVTEAVDLTPEQRRAYDAIKASDDLVGDAKLTALVRAATLTNDAAGAVVSSKLERLMEIIGDEAPDVQVVALCNSRTFVREAARRCKAEKITCAVIEGETSDQRRTEIVAAFRAGRLRVVFGTAAAERGLNLQSGGILVSCDLPWNPGIWHQRVGRIRRIGSRHTAVRVVNLVGADTVEQYVAEVVYKKQALFDAVSGAETDIKPMSAVAPSPRDLLKKA